MILLERSKRRWWQKPFAIGLGSFLVAVGLSLALLYWWYRGPELKPEVSAQLARAAGSRDTIIELRDYATFEWTDVYVIPPYTNKATAEKAMGISWPWLWNAIAFRDEFVLLVFVDSQRIAGIVEHPRNLGDFADVPHVQHYTRANARFTVTGSYPDTSRVVFRPNVRPPRAR